jgi:predicted amidophosphoribosyltransferase
MNATLYDPSDVAFGAQPRLVCAGCGQIEVGTYEPVCPECRKSLEQAGILKPKSEPAQTGPLGE